MFDVCVSALCVEMWMRMRMRMWILCVCVCLRCVCSTATFDDATLTDESSHETPLNGETEGRKREWKWRGGWGCQVEEKWKWITSVPLKEIQGRGWRWWWHGKRWWSCWWSNTTHAYPMCIPLMEKERRTTGGEKRKEEKVLLVQRCWWVCVLILNGKHCMSSSFHFFLCCCFCLSIYPAPRACGCVSWCGCGCVWCIESIVSSWMADGGMWCNPCIESCIWFCLFSLSVKYTQNTLLTSSSSSSSLSLSIAAAPVSYCKVCFVCLILCLFSYSKLAEKRGAN